MAYGFFSVYRTWISLSRGICSKGLDVQVADKRVNTIWGALQQVEYRQKIKDMDLLKQVLIPEQLVRYDQPRTDKGCY